MKDEVFVQLKRFPRELRDRIKVEAVTRSLAAGRQVTMQDVIIDLLVTSLEQQREGKA